MRTTRDTLSDALASYAVMLNRPQWLDPARTLLQEQVWLRMIADELGNETIRLEDFELAIKQRLLSDPPHVIVPSSIVAMAAGFARRRQALADRLFAEHRAGSLLFNETSALMLTGNLDQFRTAVSAATNAVIQSGRLISAVGEMVDAIEEASRTAQAELEQRTPVLEDQDPPPSATLIRAWLGEDVAP